MPKPFSYWLPEWMQNTINTRTCSQCKNPYTKEDIIAIGVRSTDNGSLECSMYIEHECSSCGYRALTTFAQQKETSLEGMCCAILENIRRKKKTEKSRMLRKRKEGIMTEREVSQFLNSMQKFKTHEEFLKEIGMSLPKEKDNDTS
ncbi:hypothetical protein LCGC14_3168580 [marine sediment metagenome]|uniref:Uncharacterized protein n=1 Tax=marine sediment metagenome TaxID=412755 RepID=A0A0F8W5F3_9ZZZZ